MPRNGSGTYSLPAGNPVATQTLITSNWANTTMSDLATALTQSLTRDGQTTPTANIPMGGFRLTGLGDPVARGDAANLGFMQDGKATRITGVAGVNQITGNLPGSPTALVNGMFMQVIPANNNTGPVTLNVNSIGFKQVVTSAGSDLAAGNFKAASPYVLMYDGTKFIVTAGNLGPFAQGAMSGWDRPASGTYPSLTVVDTTTVGIPSGTGRIIVPGAKDQTGVIEVSWMAQNVVVNTATAWETHIGVSAAGVVTLFPGALSPTYARDYVMLGTAVHVNGTITRVTTRPTIYGDMSYAAYDMATLLQNTILSGGRLLPNGTSPFQINVEAGTLFSIGSDPNEIASPNIDEFPAALNVQFYPITGTNGVGALTADVPVASYDPNGAGTVTAIPGTTTASIHRLYLMSGQYLFLYGQKTYTDLNEALSQIAVDSSATVYPSKLADATLIGYVVAQKDAANLNDATKARLVAKGGSDFTIGSSGSISEAPSDGLTYGRKNTVWVETIPMPRGASTTLRFVYYYTNSTARASIGVNDTPESGSNSGSDLDFRVYNDAGTLILTAMRIVRATGLVNFYGGVANYFGPVNTQQVLESYGWNNGVPRWKWVMESDAKWSLFSCNSAGGVPTTTLQVGSAVAGGAAFTFLGNQVWHAGNFDPAAKANDSAVVHLAGTETITGTKTFAYTRWYSPGAVNTQQIFQEFGWSNNVSRWKWVMESNASWALYSYDTAGGTATATLNIGSSAAGGQMFTFLGNTVWHAGNFDPATKANLSGANFTGSVTAIGEIKATGGGAGLLWESRSDSSKTWQWYASGTEAFLWRNDAGNLLTVNTSGQIIAAGAVITGGSHFDSTAANVVLSCIGGTIFLRPNGAESGTGEVAVNSFGQLIDDKGYLRAIPQNVQNAAYTFAAADSGKHVIKTDSTARTYTIPANSTVAYAVGTAITVVNQGGTSNNVTIALAGGVTVWRNGVSGSFTLVPGQMATLLKVGTDAWQA